MYCPKCGTKQVEGATICTNCNTILNQTSCDNNKVNNSSNSSIGWGVLGFFVPIVGVCLYAIWQNDRPADSKAAGLGALIGFIGSIVLSVLVLILYFFIIIMSMA